jgi:hypothetical protein
VSVTLPTSPLAIRSAIRAVAGRARVWHLASLLLALGLCAAAARPDLWLVERVTFTGAARADERALRHLADVPNGTRLWAVFAPSVERRVERHPWVRQASASVRLDGTLLIEVVEHEPVAVLHHGGAWLVDAEGVPFARAGLDDANLPHITGIDDALSDAHPSLPRAAIRSALDLLRGLEGRGIVHPADVSEVAFSRTSGFRVVTDSASLRFGLDGHEPQLDRLASVLADDPELLGRDLDIDLAPSRVARIRPRTLARL